MIKSVVTAIGAAVLASACATPYSETPLATNFATSKQHKLQAASHWNLISRDVALRLSASLPRDAAVFVNQASEQTAFERAFTAQLLTALVQAGHPVMKSPEGALRIGIDTQAIPFSADRLQNRDFGSATALGAGVWAVYDLVEYASNGAGKAAMLGLVALDANKWLQSEFASGETPQHEIIITTTVSDASRYIARDTSVYYVADADRTLYLPEAVLSAGAPQVIIKTFQVVGDE